MASAARLRAYASHSNLLVGEVLLSTSRRIFIGCSIAQKQGILE